MAADEIKALGPETDPSPTSHLGSVQGGNMVVAVAGPYTKEGSYRPQTKQNSLLRHQPKLARVLTTSVYIAAPLWG